MFTADAFIDTVQTGKKTWVNTFVTNELVKDAMISFIDNQADYTKKAIKATISVAISATCQEPLLSTIKTTESHTFRPALKVSNSATD